jgi:hypothetical protein
MRNRYKITCPAIDWVIDGEFVRKMDTQYCAVLYHFTVKKTFIYNKANILLSMSANISRISKAGYKLENDITEFMDIVINKGYIDLYRTFCIFFTGCHMGIIPQNYVKCNFINERTDK